MDSSGNPGDPRSVVSIRGLKVNMMTARGGVRAVRGIDMDIGRGEIHGLVGESGCGKSVTAKSIMRLHDEQTMFYEGRIFFDGKDILSMTDTDMVSVRGREISMIFQDPMTALNPLYTVGSQVSEALADAPHGESRISARHAAKAGAVELMGEVGVNPPEERMKQYPFEMSGGMLQRVMIAMAVARRPKLLIADEPTTALDVTVQLQILELLLRLKNEFGMSILMITHNFGVVAEVCGAVSVMYAGRIIESGRVEEIFGAPLHPYTRDLMKSIPRPGHRGVRLETIPGSPPDLRFRITGCSYAPRCGYADAMCGSETPAMRKISDTHSFACVRGTGGG